MAANNVIRLVQPAARPEIVEGSFEVELRKLIHAAELTSMQSEAQRIADGANIFDGPLARLWTPPTLVDTYTNQHLGPGEQIELWSTGGQVPQSFQLVRGDTKYLRWRRQWGAYPEVLRRLRERLGEKEVWPMMYQLFDFAYGVMAVCRHTYRNKNYVLCLVRGGQLDTANVGKLSFLAGLVKPFESLDAAVRREALHEGLRGIPTSYPGWVRADFPDLPSLTFGRLLQVSSVRGFDVGETYEAKGGKLIWILQPDLAAFAAGGDSRKIVRCFGRAGVELPDTVTMAGDARIVFNTFMGIFPT